MAIGPKESSDAATLKQEEDPAGADRTLTLLVIGQGGLASYPLPRTGSVVIGRGEDVDIKILDPLISRRNTTLHLGLHLGEKLAVEDLGSVNGTRVNGEIVRPRERVPLDVGQPFEIGTVLFVAKRGARKPAAPADRDGGAASIVILDAAMQSLHDLAKRAAASTIGVLLLGETGVGKEVLAETVHRHSPRNGKPFLKLNCAALSETLLESELFGYERGAFTGAGQAKPGLLETANQGTVFLDEVGELPPTVQAKLLRVLEDRRVLRVGGVESRPADVRFIAATNRDLEAEVERGTFRRDLFFRLNGMTLVIPPLRQRPGEIEALARVFVRRASKELGRSAEPALSEEALDLLRAQPWPGNIRELRNAIERAVLLCNGPAILPEHLPPPRAALPQAAQRSDAPVEGAAPPNLRSELDAIERQRILDALAECAGNQTHAAKRLGISRGTLLSRLERYGIPRPRPKGRAGRP